jgi:hypothetical protein
MNDVKWLAELDLRFLGPELDPKCKNAILKQDFSVQIREMIFLAPEGMITDGASIPRLFWRLIGSPFTGKYRRAAIIHDAAYQGKLELYTDKGAKISTRLDRLSSDGLFLVLMEADGASQVLSHTIYQAVRIAGRWSWTA